MKVAIKNLGVLYQGEFEVADFTIICGENNTGKTYITYALYGFLESYAKNALKVGIIEDRLVTELLENGHITINLKDYTGQTQRILERICRKYTRSLSTIFASEADYFKETVFDISLPDSETFIARPHRSSIATSKSEILSIIKEEKSLELTITLLTGKTGTEIPGVIIRDAINNTINKILFGDSIPNVFISSAERTGATIFYKELDIARNQLLDQMASDKEIDPMKLLFRSYTRYPLPVRNNVDFARSISDIPRENSFIAEEHPELIEYFNNLVGGKYEVKKKPEDTVHFKPKGSKLKLTMSECSSSVRSLLDINFYLRHMAKKGDILMIDEPELNLHPANQCRLARLFVQLVNVGIKVFITTHSDYIIKELNTLIMLKHNQEEKHITELMEKENYRLSELLDSDKIKVYIAKKARIKENGQNYSRNTIIKAKITPEYGVEATSFDNTIDKMNEIQDEIMWGKEE